MKIFDWLKDWWKFRQLDKEVDSNVNVWSNDRIDYIQEDKEQKYYSGMANLKQEIKRRAKDGNLQEVLRDIGDNALELARRESKQETEARKLRESVYIYQGQDVKTEEDRIKMIDQRINHYKNLQDYNVQRDLLKKARKAYKEGNLELHKQLLKQIGELYG